MTNDVFIVKKNFTLNYSDIQTYNIDEDVHISGAITLEKVNLLFSCLESQNSVLIERGENYKDFLYDNQEKGLLMLTTSGTTAIPKLVAHDKFRFIERLKKSKKSFKTCLFMPWYHIGGLHTLLYVAFSGGTCYIPESYNVSYFLDFVFENEIEVLAITPSYLNLLLLNPNFENKTKSVKIITCGSEPFVGTIAQNLTNRAPWIEIKQKFGSTETGVLDSRTCKEDPEWIQLAPNGNWKIENDMLYTKSSISCKWILENGVKTDTTEYHCTGDYVETRGDGYIKILGRKSNTINVGGNNVFPQEVRSKILSLEYIRDVRVYSKDNRLLGSVVAVDICLNPQNKQEYSKKRFLIDLSSVLERYKMPFYINIVEDIKYNDRHKMEVKNG